MGALDKTVAAARPCLRAALIVVIACWIVDVPGLLGRAYYTEQFLALVLALGTTLVLLDNAPAASPLTSSHSPSKTVPMACNR